MLQETGLGFNAVAIPSWLYAVMKFTLWINDWSVRLCDRASAALLSLMGTAELIRVLLVQESSMLRTSSVSGVAGVQVDPRPAL